MKKQMIQDVIETVGELIAALKECDPTGKIEISDGRNMFLVKSEKGKTTVQVTGP